MKSIKYVLILLLLSIFITSCSDYLDEKSETNITVDAIYTTPEGLSKASVGLYYFNRRILRYGSNNDSEMFAGIIRGTDIEISRTGPLGSTAFAYYRPNDLFGYRYLQRYWDLYYQIVGKANEIIFYGEQLNSDEFKAQRAIAEAKYFRALSYLQLYIRFNNIYLNTTPTTPENLLDERTYVPANKDDIFQLISDDLDDAIAILDVTDMGELGRITKGAARHVKLIASMWEEDWDGAIAQGELMEQSGAYSLVPLNNLFGQVDYNHSEVISSWQYFEDLGGADFAGQWGYSGHRAKALFVPEYRRRNGNEYSEVNGGHGRGWIFPNPYLLSLYDQQNDQRYNAFYRHEYFFTNASAAASDGLNVGDVIPPRGNPIDDINIHVGLKKFEDVSTYPINDSKGFSDVMQFRYAQTCILMAEAYLRKSNMGKALEWYNKTWMRAGNAPKTDNLVMQDIMDEHARELGLEGHRWAFLKRIGKLESQIKLYAGEEGYNTEARDNFQPYNVNWPIPPAQLDIFGSSFPQNPGYPN